MILKLHYSYRNATLTVASIDRFTFSYVPTHVVRRRTHTIPARGVPNARTYTYCYTPKDLSAVTVYVYVCARRTY